MRKGDVSARQSPSLGGVGGASFLGRSPSSKPKPAPKHSGDTSLFPAQPRDGGALDETSYRLERNFEHSQFSHAVGGGGAPPPPRTRTSSPLRQETSSLLTGDVARGMATAMPTAARFRPQNKATAVGANEQPAMPAGGIRRASGGVATTGGSTYLSGLSSEEPTHATREQRLDYEARTVVLFGVPNELHEELLKKINREYGAVQHTKRIGRLALQITCSSLEGTKKVLKLDGMIIFDMKRVNVVRLSEWLVISQTAAPTNTAASFTGVGGPPSDPTGESATGTISGTAATNDGFQKASQSGGAAKVTAGGGLCAVRYPLLMRLPFADKVVLPILRRLRCAELAEGALKRKR